MASHNPVFRSGNTAVITGAASGIGLALSQKCASYGMKVIMIDINASNLAAAKALIVGNVEIVEMDVSRIVEYESLKAKIISEFNGTISLLVLNAGIVIKSNWTDTEYFHRVIDVNVFGVIHGLNTLLTLVTKNSTAENPSAVVITGSKQGITNPPGNPAYNASKAAIKTLAEHLAFDLSKLSPNTSVHLLVPGWTFTGLSGNLAFAPAQEKRAKPSGAWLPEEVVEYLEKKMLEKKFYVICPDNDVDEALDIARIAWGADDLILGRPPLTRWREEWKEESDKWLKNKTIGETANQPSR
ncbi:3-beta-hydroxycholanate 3-dehydrogenase 2 [Golovinomyces cichoracearum]|uniref:3-beta-hydroxycholanate 3-dehydrogenase 2 n=1 Tax=Golovinomyces cichoracearum TaxID=62708 RepID=A0A420HFG6_9PEZI|nr:3-beta-hydroxycholanate 3-dehydrogenase 2 [Golovinomyces cichoracearum]